MMTNHADDKLFLAAAMKEENYPTAGLSADGQESLLLAASRKEDGNPLAGLPQPAEVEAERFVGQMGAALTALSPVASVCAIRLLLNLVIVRKALDNKAATELLAIEAAARAARTAIDDR